MFLCWWYFHWGPFCTCHHFSVRLISWSLLTVSVIMCRQHLASHVMFVSPTNMMCRFTVQLVRLNMRADLSSVLMMLSGTLMSSLVLKCVFGFWRVVLSEESHLMLLNRHTPAPFSPLTSTLLVRHAWVVITYRHQDKEEICLSLTDRATDRERAGKTMWIYIYVSWLYVSVEICNFTVTQNN